MKKYAYEEIRELLENNAEITFKMFYETWTIRKEPDVDNLDKNELALVIGHKIVDSFYVEDIMKLFQFETEITAKKELKLYSKEEMFEKCLDYLLTILNGVGGVYTESDLWNIVNKQYIHVYATTYLTTEISREEFFDEFVAKLEDKHNYIAYRAREVYRMPLDEKYRKEYEVEENEKAFFISFIKYENLEERKIAQEIYVDDSYACATKFNLSIHQLEEEKADVEKTIKLEKADFDKQSEVGKQYATEKIIALEKTVERIDKAIEVKMNVLKRVQQI